jgi:hypothetical protein
MEFELQPGETVVARYRALMYRGGGWSGWRGFLTITDRRLFFEARVFGHGTDEEIGFDEVASATLLRTLGLIPNRVRVVMLDGRVIDFVTSGRRRVVDTIEQAARR